MKKVKSVIIIIYVIFFILISGLTIFFIVKTVKKGSDLYFEQKQQAPFELPFKEQDINNLIDILKKIKLL
jgi:flagellar basal body-associated protein FliL